MSSSTGPSRATFYQGAKAVGVTAMVAAFVVAAQDVVWVLVDTLFG